MEDDYCSICLNSNKNDIFKKLKCNHKFHISCIIKWFNECEYMNCPICRQNIEIPYLFNFNQNTKNVYKLHLNNFKYFPNTVLINYNNIINPICWSMTNSNNNELFLPIYNFKNLKITLFSRLYLLYNKFNKITDLNFTKKETLNDIILYDLENKYILGNLDNNLIEELFDFVYELFTFIKNKNNITYLSCSNTLTFDLFIVSLINFKYNFIYPDNEDQEKIIHLYKIILISAVYNTIVFLENKYIKINVIKEYYNFNLDSMYHILEFQNNFIYNNLNLI